MREIKSARKFSISRMRENLSARKFIRIRYDVTGFFADSVDNPPTLNVISKWLKEILNLYPAYLLKYIIYNPTRNMDWRECNLFKCEGQRV